MTDHVVPDHARPVDERDARALDEAAERAEEEARTLAMLADAGGRTGQAAGIAACDRAVCAELEMEAEYLRRKAAERSARRGIAVGGRRAARC